MINDFDARLSHPLTSHYDRFLPRSGVASPINTPPSTYIDDGLTYLRVITAWVASFTRQPFLPPRFLTSSSRGQSFINEPTHVSSRIASPILASLALFYIGGKKFRFVANPHMMGRILVISNKLLRLIAIIIYKIIFHSSFSLIRYVRMKLRYFYYLDYSSRKLG